VCFTQEGDGEKEQSLKAWFKTVADFTTCSALLNLLTLCRSHEMLSVTKAEFLDLFHIVFTDCYQKDAL